MAQHSRFELTPTVGYRWGGGIDVYERALEFDNYDVDVDASGSYGLRLGVDISPRLQFELLFSRQPGEFVDEHGLFSEWFTQLYPPDCIPPGADDPVDPCYIIEGRGEILDVNVTYLHGGLVWSLRDGESSPYLVGSLGVARVDPRVQLHTETGLSASVGGGYKWTLSKRLGLRFEGRAFVTDMDEAVGVEQVSHPDCEVPCTYTYRYPDFLIQFEAMVGLSVRL